MCEIGIYCGRGLGVQVGEGEKGLTLLTGEQKIR